MGSNMAYELADKDIFPNLSLEKAIGYHLQGNHYPPVPLIMVEPCIEAIDAYWEDDINRLINMPEGVSYKGKDTAPAWAIIEQHHLDPWISDTPWDTQECCEHEYESGCACCMGECENTEEE